MTTRQTLGDAGLDRVLGGGLPVVDRGTGRPNSVVLIRGPAGAGKTLFAARIAAALAGARAANILWACVEILPIEVSAQLQGLTEAKLPPVCANSLFGDEPPPHAPAIVAEPLEIEGVEAPTGRVDLVQRLLDLLEQLKHREIDSPGVIVVDSLTVGYGIGANIDRVIADGLCKMAHARGLSLVLVEESDLSEQSLWTYAVDAVFELDRRPKSRERGVAFSREIVIAKNRFGFANVGPHQLQISAQGVTVLPRPGSYSALPQARSPRASASVRFVYGERSEARLLPIISGRLLSILGSDVGAVRRCAHRVVDMHPKTAPLLVLEFGAALSDLSALHRGQGLVKRLSLSHPFLTPHEILSRATDAFEAIDAGGSTEPPIVLIGDCGAVDGFGAADEVHRALAVYCDWARARGSAIVAFNSRRQESFVGIGAGGRSFSAAGSAPLPVHAIADVHLELQTIPTQSDAYFEVLTEPSSGGRWRVGGLSAPLT